MEGRESYQKPEILLIDYCDVRGLKTMGFLFVLERNGVLDNVKIYSSVSTGSVIALLLCCGYNTRQITEFMLATNVIGNIAGYIQNGPSSAPELDSVRLKLTKMVESRFFTVPSLNTLHMMTGKVLSTVTYDSQRNVPLYINNKTYPSISCIDAVMLSFNTPFYGYQRLFEHHACNDGMVGHPYPLYYFDDGTRDILGVSTKKYFNTANDAKEACIRCVTVLCEQKTELEIRNASKRCRNIVLRVDHDEERRSVYSAKSKASLIIQGVKEGLLFLETVYDPHSSSSSSEESYF